MYWLAGIIEGEATFFYDRSPKRSKYPIVITISMTDRDIIKRIAVIFNTALIKDDYAHRKNSRYKVMYKTRKCGFRALRLMQMIYPIMGERRKERFEYLFRKCGLDINIKLLNKFRGNCKLTWEQIDKIRKRFQNGESPYKIAHDYPVTGSHISKICYNRSYKKKFSLFTQGR